MKILGMVAAALLLVAVFAFGFLWTPATGDRAAGTVRIGVLPDQDAATLRANFAPLLDHLANRTGQAYELLIPNDYTDLLVLFEDGTVDLAYFGGLTFVQARQNAGAQPLVMRAADRRFTTSFVVRNEAPWTGCDQLACPELGGAVLSFGARLSTSGHLMPRYYLKSELGITAEDFFGGTRYSGAHDKTALDVRSGVAAIGAMNTAIFTEMQADGRLGPDDLIRIWETPPYADYVWAIQAEFDRAAAIAIRDAFLELDVFDPADRAVLDGLRARAFVPASARDYEALSSIAASAGLLVNQ